MIAENLAAFDLRYDVAGNGIPVAGVYTGSLDNDGEKIKLLREGDHEPTGRIPYYRIDYVDYDDATPWPLEADGRGSSLNRIDASQYGNDPINWEAGNLGGTPGAANIVIDRTPPSAPGGITGHTTINPDTISLTWNAAQDLDSYVDHYVVYRDGDYFDTSATAVVRRHRRGDRRLIHLQGLGGESRRLRGPVVQRIVLAMPGIVSYEVTDTTHIVLTFSEPLNPATAAVLSNYTFVGGTLAGVQLNGASGHADHRAATGHRQHLFGHRATA